MMIKPSRPGLLVAMPGAPVGTFLPDEGKDVRPTTYWRRRLRVGDVVLVEEPKPRRRAAAKDTDADDTER